MVVETARDHGDIAARFLHWFDSDSSSWLTQVHGGSWAGWGAEGESRTASCGTVPDRMWAADLDASGAPFYKWFVGGLTNAAFNEVDRNVLGGNGERDAFKCATLPVYCPGVAGESKLDTQSVSCIECVCVIFGLQASHAWPAA